MYKGKKQNQWTGLLVDELNRQAQKSFQVGVFEEITDSTINLR